MSEFTNEPVARTDVWHAGLRYVVSTINRESSAAVTPPPIYAETLVWDTDANGGLQNLIWQGEARRGSIATHMRVLEMLCHSGPDSLGVPEMSKRKKEQHAASKRGRVCKACHQWRNAWEFSATDVVCIDCKRAIGVQGLDALEVYLTPAPQIEQGATK